MPGQMQNILDILPVDGACKTVKEISEASGVAREEVSQYCCRLKSSGLVSRPKTGCYLLTAGGREARDAGKKISAGPNGPHTGRRKRMTGTIREKIWVALRAKRKATVPELLAAAGVADPKKSVNNAHQYLRRLRLAGYVAVTGLREPGTAPTSNGFQRYLLLKDTGPKAPVFCRKKGEPGHLFDPNTCEEIFSTTETGDAK